MAEFMFTCAVMRVIRYATEAVQKLRHEFLTPEHLLLAIANMPIGEMTFKSQGVDADAFRLAVGEYLSQLESVLTEAPVHNGPLTSHQTSKIIELSIRQVYDSGEKKIHITHLIAAMLELKESNANFILRRFFGANKDAIISAFQETASNLPDEEFDFTGEKAEWESLLNEDDMEEEEMEDNDASIHRPWHTLVTCINEQTSQHHQLIGREAEMERTLQILGRKDNCHVMHLGEPGVGKTALIHGLAHRIALGHVPDDLLGTRIYAIDMTTLLAGANMRGELEKRIKQILDGASAEGRCIIYIEDIHTLASSPGGDTMSALAMLKPYLSGHGIRFIGSTTYATYNRDLSRHRAIVRHFQQVEVLEPTCEETLRIIQGLLPEYEHFHHVRYTPEAIKHAIEKSHLLITDRFLPEKAIDIIDEAGSMRKRHLLLDKNGKPKAERYQKVDVALVNDVLSKVCKLNAKALTESSNESLAHLDTRMAAQIYGQDEAIRTVAQAIQMAKAGLSAPDKPLASLLFVGPTGVGKTELCRVLASELGIELVRFDMSEYTEKHTVAKLIGSPAGYVGYEDGGLLTDAIRKTPNCVLLLDEIEKAHEDIYNILLQVMDYARLTDNRGNKADFRGVVLIMTSNAGAQFASHSSMGFDNRVSRGEAMLQTVKKTFKPEFLNRLSSTIVFRDMDQNMASLILDKKLRILRERLSSKSVTMELSDDARNILLRKGFTPQYGAREMDRVIQQILSPLLMREILFGALQRGGHAVVHSGADGLDIICKKKQKR